MFLRLSAVTLSMIGPEAVSSARRLKPSESNAPALMSDSTARRFRSRGTIRRQNSSSVRNGPPLSRSALSSSMKPQPMPLMATRPKRMFSPETVKSASDSFTSGGRSLMPMSRHSAIYSATFVLLSSTLVSSAAIYSRGWWHFMYAVR